MGAETCCADFIDSTGGKDPCELGHVPTCFREMGVTICTHKQCPRGSNKGYSWGRVSTSLGGGHPRCREREGTKIQSRFSPSLMHRIQLLLADELRELVKGFLARLEFDSAAYKVTTSSKGHWTTALRWCPRELLDLINSKACRGTYTLNTRKSLRFLTLVAGAIMFNDPLDIDQCKRLILQLSNTIWPFICAHGR